MYVSALLRDESGSAAVGFIATATLTGLVAMGFMLGSWALGNSVQYDGLDRGVGSVQQEVCAFIYAAGQDPSTAAALQTYGGGTQEVDVVQPIGTPMPVTVTLKAANAGNIPIVVTANAMKMPGSCPIPTPVPSYGTETNP